MNPFDWGLIILPSLLLFYFLYYAWKEGDSVATRKKKLAAMEDAINLWIEDPTSENHETARRAVEEYYG